MKGPDFISPETQLNCPDPKSGENVQIALARLPHSAEPLILMSSSPPGARSKGPLIIAGLVVVLLILHQDNWFWTDGRLVIGSANEVQQISHVGESAFEVTFQDDTTDPIDGTASAEQVQSALESLPSIETGGVSVRGSGGEWEVEFVGDMANQGQPEMTAISDEGDLVTYTITQGGGVMPIGLLWHALISVGATITWFLSTKIAWPFEETVATEKGTE